MVLKSITLRSGMQDPIIDTCVEQGLQAEQDLLASVCAGAADHGAAALATQ